MQLTGAIEQKIEELKGRLAQLAASPDFAEPAPADRAEAPPAPPPAFDFVGLFAEDDGKKLVKAYARKSADLADAPALLADLLESAQAGGEEAARTSSAVSRLLYDGATALAAVARPASAGRAGRFLIGGYKRLDADELRGIADTHAIDGLRLVVAPPAEGWIGLPILDARGEAKAYLAWRPERPGDVMRERLVPLTLFGSLVAIALFAFVFGYIRWIARDLSASQEHAQNLLGRDPLSGLPNRLLFGERLDHELIRIGRSGAGLAVMFLDLDRFKDSTTLNGC
jgi:hypothetical protein